MGLLCCLPKKPSGADPTTGEYYSAENTRPLSIVNTDNRLIANSYRLRWEPIFAKWVSEYQRGFLPGRSMLSNVIDVDYEAMTVSLTQPQGAIILFDFRAAFPSISHTYLFKVLEHIGLPRRAMHLLEALYDRNRCIIACGGTHFDGFLMKAGIRQGCPLSPLLFAVVVDMLLRKLADHFPGELIRAFADDTAMVVTDWWRTSSGLQSVFEEFGLISGLVLNIPKTVIIPLWPADIDKVRAEVAHRLHAWREVAVAGWGKYLGFATGPEKKSHSWDGALAKFLERIRAWDWSSLGLQFAATAYNTYAMSVLSYVAQLEQPPERVIEAERSALRKVAKGPGNWAKPEDLWFYKENFGGAVSFASMHFTAWSSQVRVCTWEGIARGGIHATQRASALGLTLTVGEYMGRRRTWDDWYKMSHVCVLRSAMERLSGAGISLSSIFNELAHDEPPPWNQRRLAIVKKGFQRQVRMRLLARHCPDAEERLRHKLKRWRFDGIPRLLVCRSIQRLRRLRSLVPPRVGAAVFSTLWNRWTTARRFQRRASRDNRCVMGCAGHAEDSLEHYGRCKVILNFACRRLNLRFADNDALPHWMLVAEGSPSDDIPDVQIRTSVMLYAAYRATNTLRRRVSLDEVDRGSSSSSDCGNGSVTDSDSTSSDSSDDSSNRKQSSVSVSSHGDNARKERINFANEMLAQYVHEATRDHRQTTEAIDRCWTDTTRGNPRRRLADARQ